jgi:glycosyltransferase involved in cell wall biosynthesis
MSAHNTIQSPKIIFLSITNLLSKKAYTITTKNTFDAVLEHGHSASMVAPDIDFFNLNNAPSRLVLFLQKVTLYSRSKFNSPKFWEGKFHFHLFEMSFLLMIKLSKRIEGADVIWTRSILAPLIIGKKFCYLIEIHQPLSTWKKYLIFIQKVIRVNVFFAPINELLKENVLACRVKSRKVFILPMAVNRFFLSKYPPPNHSAFDIGFFGSLRSNSNPQGVFCLIEQLIICREFNPEFKCLFVGFSNSEMQELNQYVASTQLSIDWITIFPRLEHSQVPSLMQNCKFLVLPYPDDRFNTARYPLKALEYAATGRTIFASDTRGNRAIFTDDEVFFYDHRDRFSIHKLIQFYATVEKDSLHSMLINARSKALAHTYYERAKTALEFLGLEGKSWKSRNQEF